MNIRHKTVAMYQDLLVSVASTHLPESSKMGHTYRRMPLTCGYGLVCASRIQSQLVVFPNIGHGEPDHGWAPVLSSYANYSSQRRLNLQLVCFCVSPVCFRSQVYVVTVMKISNEEVGRFTSLLCSFSVEIGVLSLRSMVLWPFHSGLMGRHR